MPTKWTDSLAWDNGYIGKELIFSFSEGKAVSCENLETSMKTLLIMRQREKIRLLKIGTDGRTTIEFILGNIRYQVNEIIIQRIVEYRNKNGEILYIGNSRVENFLPIWFEQIKN